MCIEPQFLWFQSMTNVPIQKSTDVSTNASTRWEVTSASAGSDSSSTQMRKDAKVSRAVNFWIKSRVMYVTEGSASCVRN